MTVPALLRKCLKEEKKNPVTFHIFTHQSPVPKSRERRACLGLPFMSRWQQRTSLGGQRSLTALPILNGMRGSLCKKQPFLFYMPVFVCCQFLLTPFSYLSTCLMWNAYIHVIYVKHNVCVLYIALHKNSPPLNFSTLCSVTNWNTNWLCLFPFEQYIMQSALEMRNTFWHDIDK